MAYQALYRQWRPKDFSHMVGQEAIVETLRNQVNTGRIAHAYLFCGSRGTGKTSTAKILARAVNCEQPRNGDPCGECATCRRMESEESLDIIEIDAASNNGVDQIRDLRETVKYPPQFGKYKIYIVDEVHMLSGAAFNALLKTLEEPPEHIVFILATTEPQKLPATILSRCQRFDFGRISASAIQGRLREAVQGAGGTATPGALMAIARAAEGGMRDALSILDMCLGRGTEVNEALVRDVLGTSDRAFLFRFSAALAAEDVRGVIGLVDELMRGGKDPLVFAKDISGHLRALLMAKCCGKEITELLELTEEDAAEYIRESESFTSSRLMDMLDRYMLLETELRGASSPRIALENASLKCCLRTEPVDTLAVNDRMNELENRLTELADRIAAGAAVLPAGGKAPALREPGSGKKPEKAAVREAPKQKTLTPTGRGTDDIWKEMLQDLKKNDPGITPRLQMGTWLGAEDGVTFRWQAAAGYDVIAESLNQKQNKEKIEAALTRAAGFECHFIATDQKEAQKKKDDQSDENYVGGLVGTFGRERVDVVD